MRIQIDIHLLISKSLKKDPLYRSILLLISLLIINFDSPAQNTSVYGRFEADFTLGCDPLKLVITEIDTFPAETVRQYDFEGDGVFVGFEPAEEISFTYDQPGFYRIVQIINVDIVPKTDTLFLEVFPKEIPDFTIYTCENNGAKIEIENDQYPQYRIFYTSSDSVTINQGEEVPPFSYPAGSHTVRVKGLFLDGKDNCGVSVQSFTTIQNLVSPTLNTVRMVRKDAVEGAVNITYNLTPHVIYRVEMADDFPAGFNVMDLLPANSSSYTLDSIDTESTLPIIRISAFDACQNKSLNSDTLSTIRVSGIAENNRNRINWEVYPIKFERYEIFRDNISENVISSQNLREFIDEDVVCFTEYCYSVVFTNRNGARSYSDTVCVEAFKIYYPPPIKNTTASVRDSLVDLEWTEPEVIIPDLYFIQKLIDENVYATLDTVIVNSYTDPGSDPASGSICYRISYLDECRNRSNLGDLACSVYLMLENNRSLSWNDYVGWRNGVKHYVLEIYNEEGKLQEEINMGSANYYEIPDYLKLELVQYRIRAESNDDPSQIAFSNFAIKRIESVLWMPNAFTPNGDGLNDSFKPEGTLMQLFNMKIFNREGNLLYETEDQEDGWDGMYDGEEMPFNTYIYIIEAVDNVGKSYNRTGKLLLIRE